MHNIGESLRELREERDLKQKDVADAPKMQVFPSSEESEHRSLSSSAAPEPLQPQPTADSAEDRRILSYYHRLDTESQEAIRGLLIYYCKEQEHRRALQEDSVDENS